MKLAATIAILWALPTLAADDVADRSRAQVQETLAHMTRAVLAADQAAFLAHIAPDDAFFYTEQRHWSDQLAAAKPEMFSLDIGDGPAVFAQDRAEFPLVMSWRITSGPKESWGAGGETRTVRFPVVTFESRDGRWLYRGEKWEELKGEGFVLWHQNDDISKKVAADVLKAFPIARDHDNEGFGVTPRPQVLKLFTSMDHLKATVYLNMPDHYLGGWSEAGESIKFMTTYTSGVQGWTNAYAHEYGHVCTWELGPHAAATPWWVQEGVAELAAQEFRPGYWPKLDAQMRALAQKGALPAFADISDYMTTRQSLKQLAYTQGHHMLGYISQRWGREGRNRWLRLMAADGKSLDAATQEVFQRSFADLDREWRATLAAPPEQPVRSTP